MKPCSSDLESPIELSIVIPCLNEADTIAHCIRVAQKTLTSQGIAGEVVVADNSSTDASRAIAEGTGAVVVIASERGYGSALMAGIAAARGTYILMADADESYDFQEAPRFLEKLREGYELVQGCRLPLGGGTVLPGAMPFLHRWFGNPLFSLLARWWFRTPVHDVNCGMRAFAKHFFDQLNQKCTGMEFAVEMIIKASLMKAKIAEVPITLHPDGRIKNEPHLRTFRDGWRTLRVFLMFSSSGVFLFPGVMMIVLGLVGYGIAMPGLRLLGIRFDTQTLLVASLALLTGYQAILFFTLTRAFAITEGFVADHGRFARIGHWLNRRGLAIGALATGVGVLILGSAVNQWRLVDFGDLQYIQTMRWVIPGVTLVLMGLQTLFSSALLSLLGMSRN